MVSSIKQLQYLAPTKGPNVVIDLDIPYVKINGSKMLLVGPMICRYALGFPKRAIKKMSTTKGLNVFLDLDILYVRVNDSRALLVGAKTICPGAP